jgi:hypothetical protein
MPKVILTLQASIPDTITIGVSTRRWAGTWHRQEQISLPIKSLDMTGQFDVGSFPDATSLCSVLLSDLDEGYTLHMANNLWDASNRPRYTCSHGSYTWIISRKGNGLRKSLLLAMNHHSRRQHFPCSSTSDGTPWRRSFPSLRRQDFPLMQHGLHTSERDLTQPPSKQAASNNFPVSPASMISHPPTITSKLHLYCQLRPPANYPISRQKNASPS